ncbi:MAG: response regulator [Desulfovibrio sp.]|jgi:putative two-component system response regulator|nr:response regulator [Desulfovibrio sp.]
MKKNRKLIMMVDDSLANLSAGKNALSDAYTVLTVPSAAKMLELLERYKPDLILLDVDMPEMDGFAAIKRLKEQPETCDVPVIFLTGMYDDDDEMEGLSLGAIDYIVKPFSPPLLRKRVEVHLLVESQRQELQEYNTNLEGLVAKKTKTVLKLQNKILKAMAELVEGRDIITGDHIGRTQTYLGILLSAVVNSGAWEKQTTDWDTELLLQSSQLHDVGKIAIRDSILKKPGPLNAEEGEEMRRHVACGVYFVEKLEDDEEDSRFLRFAKIFVSFHHEKWDGSGYPHGLSGEDIPLLGRLMAIADVYDALSSDRPYKKAYSHEDSARFIREGGGKHFDPALTELFERVEERFAETLSSWNIPTRNGAARP